MIKISFSRVSFKYDTSWNGNSSRHAGFKAFMLDAISHWRSRTTEIIRIVFFLFSAYVVDVISLALYLCEFFVRCRWKLRMIVHWFTCFMPAASAYIVYNSVSGQRLSCCRAASVSKMIVSPLSQING